MNSLYLLGRITKDPEVRYTESGKAYCRFTLAVDSDKDQADFIPCVCWGVTAENMYKYVQKGRQLLVQGKMQSGSYKDQNGEIRYTLDAYAYRIQFLAKPKSQQEHNSIDGFEQSVEDEELPF